MASLDETATWEVGIRQFEITDAATGGPGGLMNTAIGQLANRTVYLKGRADDFDAGRLFPVVAGTAEVGPTVEAVDADRGRAVIVLGDADSPDTIWIALRDAGGVCRWTNFN